MSKEVKLFFIMPGAVPVLQSDSPAYTPMTNCETDVHTVPVVLGEDYDALLAERDAAQKDAERYRWLIDSGNDTYSMFVEAEDKAALDAAIDAALQGERP